MRQVFEVLRLTHDQCLSQHAVAPALELAQSTVRQFPAVPGDGVGLADPARARCGHGRRRACAVATPKGDVAVRRWATRVAKGRDIEEFTATGAPPIVVA